MAALRIYFAGSIRGGREDVQLYMKIIKILQRYGTVLTEHVADPKLEECGIGIDITIVLIHVSTILLMAVQSM